MVFMPNRLTFVLSLVFSSLLFLTQVPPVSASQVQECRIESSRNALVSLGFPLAPERLGNKKSVNVLVLPFRLADVPSYTFTEYFREDYIKASQYIEQLSNGLVKVNLKFSDVIDVTYTSADMVTLTINQQKSWSDRDESKSTWGFIRKLIQDIDSQVDFKDVDSVYLHGSSAARGSQIAEAMMFSANPTEPWFRPVKTSEGNIYNAVLMDRHQNSATIAHEILHNFGLTDLYGSSTSPEMLSLMSSNTISLLSYEKWILGWLPDSRVQCLIEIRDIDQSNTSTRILMPNDGLDNVLVIRTQEDRTALVIETSTINQTGESDGQKFLSFYSLHNDQRPPIKMFMPTRSSKTIAIKVREGKNLETDAIGATIQADRYELIITDINDSNFVLHLVPKGQTSNAASLFEESVSNKKLAEIRELEKRMKAATVEVTKQDTETKNSDTIETVKSEPKKRVITCIKGDKLKKISAVKPKCPKGFKKK